jgi:hypothetical protein
MCEVRVEDRRPGVFAVFILLYINLFRTNGRWDSMEHIALISWTSSTTLIRPTEHAVKTGHRCSTQSCFSRK